jgi:hypothetical protein
VQLHRVIAAERSAVVPEEDQYGWPLPPGVAEANVVAAEVLEDEIRQIARVAGPTHVLTLPGGSKHA